MINTGFLVYVASCLLVGEATICTTEEITRILEVREFQQYIQIDTVNGNNLKPTIDFWRKLVKKAGTQFFVYSFVEDFPVVVIKWPGQDSSLSSIMLNTHMDVVSADIMDGWTYPPFSAYIDETGDIYGRGTQEVKSVTMQHYQALSRLMKKNITMLRDIYMVLTPDKEAGSKNGIVPFLRSTEFKKMNVGLSISGGEPTESKEIAVLYRGKTRWSFRVDCFGPSAASSELVDPAISADGSATDGDRLICSSNLIVVSIFQCGRFYLSYAEYRTKQYQLSQRASCSDPANITVINFVGPKVNTMLGVIPSSIYLFYDAYLRVNSKFSEFEAMVKQWIVKAGNNTRLKTLLIIDAGREVTIDKCNPYWNALQSASTKLNITFDAHTAPGPEEAAFVTAAGYPSFGISPLPNTENLKHAINERLNVDTYLKGITAFEEIFMQVANIPADLLSDDPSDYLVPKT